MIDNQRLLFHGRTIKIIVQLISNIYRKLEPSYIQQNPLKDSTVGFVRSIITKVCSEQ